MNDHVSLDGRLRSALSLLQHEQDTSAEAVLREAIAANTEQAHTTLIQYAATQFDRRNYRQAITALQASLTIEPDQYAAHFNIGMALALTGRDEQAIQAYRKSIELAPGFVPAYMNLAAIYYRRKAYEAARELTEKVVALEPDGDFAVQAYCNLYDVYQKLHRSRDECFAPLQKAMEACQGRPR